MNCKDTLSRIGRKDHVDADVLGNAAAADDTIAILGLPLTRTPTLHNAICLVKPHVTRRPRSPFLVTFVNPVAVKLIENDPRFRANLRRMSLVFSDGIALTWAARRIGRHAVERVSFDSTGIAPSVFRMAEEHRRRIALVGSPPGVAQSAADRVRKHFPRLRIVAAIDGYRPVDQIISSVIATDPDIVICGMGAPRQEDLLTALADAGWCGTGFTCGGYLDQLVDRFNFYPALINRFNLRWLYRVAREPRRLGYRYLVEYAPFFRAIAQDLVRASGNPDRRRKQS